MSKQIKVETKTFRNNFELKFFISIKFKTMASMKFEKVDFDMN